MRWQIWVQAVLGAVGVVLGAASLTACSLSDFITGNIDMQGDAICERYDGVRESERKFCKSIRDPYKPNKPSKSPKERPDEPDRSDKSSEERPDDSGRSSLPPHVVMRGGRAFPESGYAWKSNGGYEGRDPSSRDLKVVKDE
ncbi:MAG: hypothetical protein FJ291_23230 [Planctomycetes bacterium]|nr:hypothetical protein [Planctomycetota bacterium]